MFLCAIEYRNDEIEAIYHEEGRIYFPKVESGQPPVNPYREYFIQDHLGNTRLVIGDKNGNNRLNVTYDPATDEVLQEQHYYPFGMAMEGPWLQHDGGKNRFLYNGKELTEDLDLNWLDYGARWYDPAIGRWNAVDMLAELAPNWSSYRYAFNNPISYVDPDGNYERDKTNVEKATEESRYESLNGISGSEKRDNALLGWISKQEVHATVYVVNDTKDALSGRNRIVDTDEETETEILTKIMNYASDIFSKNGIHNMSFKLTTKEKIIKDGVKFTDLFISIASFGQQSRPVGYADVSVLSGRTYTYGDDPGYIAYIKTYIDWNSSTI